MTLKKIPLIDLSPAYKGTLKQRQSVARQIDAACSEIGFFAITGHGVTSTVVERLHVAGRRFFELPLEEKLATRHPSGMNRGFHQIGGESLANANDSAAPPDIKEFFHVGPVNTTREAYFISAQGQRHFTANIWPAVPHEFERAATDYYVVMSELILFLMRLVSLALELDETYFDDKVDRSIGAMRLNYYPPAGLEEAVGQLPASAHTDYGGFTILSGDDSPGGLQVRGRNEQWIDVKTEPMVFVVNIGDLLMRWTNDRWLSNLHRVVYPNSPNLSSDGRLSIAFFNQPNYDTVIECLPSLGPAKYPPVLSGDYRDMKYSKTGLKGAT